MRFTKMVCLKCDHYEKCPQRTRLFINYCGSRQEIVEHEIRRAEEDCETRRGHFWPLRVAPMLQRFA